MVRNDRPDIIAADKAISKDPQRSAVAGRQEVRLLAIGLATDEQYWPTAAWRLSAAEQQKQTFRTFCSPSSRLARRHPTTWRKPL
jgi:hypothetical protein